MSMANFGIAKAIEEIGEVQELFARLHVTLAKLLGINDEWGPTPKISWTYFDGTDLKTRLEEELGDVDAAMGFIIGRLGLDIFAINDRADAKRTLFELWETQT